MRQVGRSFADLFNSIRAHDGFFDLTHHLENVVYDELLYRGYSLSVYSGKQEMGAFADIDYFTRTVVHQAMGLLGNGRFIAFQPGSK